MFKKALRVYADEGLGGVAIRVYRLFQSSVSTDPQLNYPLWCDEFDPRDKATLARLAQELPRWRVQPLVSVIMPVYNPNPQWLVAAIESVQAQIYPHWELCIADDASTRQDVRDVLLRYEQQDSRIRVRWRESNGHIAAATNSAIEISHGEYLAMLDHDDLLAPAALYWMVESLQSIPDASLIFSDEDKINERGERYNPYFKCELNRELLLAQNMVTHLAMYRADLVRELGGCRLGFEGSQDYDLILRVVDASRPNQIVHVPRLLYHWRVHSESTAGSADAKPYALLAAKKAIEEHLQRNNLKAAVETDQLNGLCRVRFALPDPVPLVSILIPTRNAHALVATCIESIRAKTDYPNYEIVLIDNGSDQAKALRYFARLQSEGVRVIRDDRPFNYSALNNAAARSARGEILVLMNNDIEVISLGWLTEMVSHACRPGIGAVGAKLLYPSDRIQHAGVVLGIGDCAGHIHKSWPVADWGYFSRANLLQNFSAVTGACLAVKKADYFEVGGLNETDLRVAFNDIDFCLKLLKNGLRNVFAPQALLYHHESATRGFEDSPEKIARFEQEVAYLRKSWRQLLANDPCYSPNLTLAHEGVSMAYPPRVSRWPASIDFGLTNRVGLVIPTLNAGPKWDLLLDAIAAQVGVCPKVVVIDSGSTDDTVALARARGHRVIEIPNNEFGHGKTRQQAVDALDCEFIVMLTQDARLASPDSLSTLLSVFEDEQIALAYGRQLAAPNATLSARVLREFNYPAKSVIRSFDDRTSLGLKCAFNSNSFAAYRSSALKAIGGFDCQVPVGEDIAACAALLQKGYLSAYVANAYVIHSHNYTFSQEFARYRDIGRMHAMRPELLMTFGKPEGEGIRLIKAELQEAMRVAPWVGLGTLVRAAVKYLGYRRGLLAN